ncbi:MAG: alpha/beta fold hydrolase [Chloroflexota bacterium]
MKDVRAIGMSSGAALALEAAAHGLSIDKLALYEPPFIVDDSRPPLPREYVAQLDALITAGRRGDAVAYTMTTAVGLPTEVVASMRDQPFWPAFEAVAHTLSYDGRVLGDTQFGSPAPLTRWSSVTVPALVVDGGASPASMQHAAQALVDVLPHARRRTLDGQTHEVAPEVLAPVLTEFFTG